MLNVFLFLDMSYYRDRNRIDFQTAFFLFVAPSCSGDATIGFFPLHIVTNTSKNNNYG